MGVAAELNYLVAQDAPVRTYAYDPPDGGPRFNATLRPHEVLVEDARAVAAGPDWLHGAGFTLQRQRSSVGDFWDERQLRRRAFGEAEELLRGLTGAPHARVFDHTLRRRAARPGQRAPLDGVGGSFAAVREPVGRVHVDYTPWSAPLRLRQVLGDRPAEQVLGGRWLILGLWRPLLEQPLRDAPLALADARSVRAAELVPNDLIYRERRGQTYAVVHSPGHRWYWHPEQTRDEVAVFVHYDSLRASQPCTGACPHSAFEHPATPADAEPRQSLELRAFVWFD